jgi:hypothetical protein
MEVLALVTKKKKKLITKWKAQHIKIRDLAHSTGSNMHALVVE